MIPWGMALGYAKDFLANNKWLAFVALLTALVLSLGNTIVSVAAYLQPKVIIHQVTIRQVQTRDKTVTEEKEVKHADGTLEMFRTIRADISSLSTQQDQSTSTKEPVALGGVASGTWSLLGGVMVVPMDKKVGLGIGAEWNLLEVTLSNPLATLSPDGLTLSLSFNPTLWAGVRVPFGAGK